jgi:predicted nucleic acid-binding protein
MLVKAELQRFLDTNVIVRFLTRDDPQAAERALDLLRRVEHREERVATSAMVIMEAVSTLEHMYGVPRERIRRDLDVLISLRGLSLPGKRLLRRALVLYGATRLSFVDAYHATYMEHRRMPEIYSWDCDFDAIEGVYRVEP